MRLRRGLSPALKPILSLALLAFVLNRVGWGETCQTLSGVRLAYLVAALALTLVGIVVRAYRWQLLLDTLGLQFSLPRLTQLYFVGAFFSTFLPTGVGGDVVRVYEVAQQSARSPEAISTVLLDRASGLLVLFLMALVALPFSRSLVGGQIAVAIVLLTLLSWGGLALLLQQAWLDRLGLLRLVRRFSMLGDVYQAMHACGATIIGRALAVSFLFNVLLIATNVLIAWALHANISLWYFVLFVPIISSLLMLPVSLSGLGVREGAYVYLFAQAGVLTSQALSMSLLVYTMNVATGLIGGILYVVQGLCELRTPGR